jgi:hypothetical protein
MAKYGEVAVDAVEFLARSPDLSPWHGWTRAAAAAFPHSRSSQEKGCPRVAVLALCESGAVQNVSPGSYTRSVKNKEYVVRAV